MDGLTIEAVAWWSVDIDDRVLVVRTHGRDAFYLPGGKPEPGESDEEAIIREVREEIGVELCDPVRMTSITAPAHGYGDHALVRLTVFGGTSSGIPKPSNEIAELAWIAPSEVDAVPLAPAVQALFRLNR